MSDLRSDFEWEGKSYYWVLNPYGWYAVYLKNNYQNCLDIPVIIFKGPPEHAAAALEGRRAGYNEGFAVGHEQARNEIKKALGV